MSILLIVHLCPLYLRCCFYRNVLIQKETVTKWLYELAWIYTPRLNYRVGVEALIKKASFSMIFVPPKRIEKEVILLYVVF